VPGDANPLPGAGRSLASRATGRSQ
jgi:hypothetical protein